jgi:hypothetical protein
VIRHIWRVGGCLFDPVALWNETDPKGPPILAGHVAARGRVDHVIEPEAELNKGQITGGASRPAARSSGDPMASSTRLRSTWIAPSRATWTRRTLVGITGVPPRAERISYASWPR